MPRFLTIIFIVLATCFAVSQTPNSKTEHHKLFEQIQNFENSLDFNSKTESIKNKKQNQVALLPPYAPENWDTILWEQPQILLTNNVSGGATMHGKVAVDDSGNVHVVSKKEDDILRYHKSTDYGTTFEPAVVIDSMTGLVNKITATENYIYVYTYSSIFSPDLSQRLYASTNKGVSWNPKTLIPYSGGHSTFEAKNDTVYAYLESVPTIVQGKSYDAGATFSTTGSIGSIYSSLQIPDVAVGQNSIIYGRTGNESQLSGSFVYRSFDLGNSWFSSLDITPFNTDTQAPDIFFSNNTFNIIQDYGNSFYTKSENGGNSFYPHLSLCISNAGNCVAEVRQQITSYKNNVFVLWNDNITYPEDRLSLRFSRDNGNNWSKILTASDLIPGFVGIEPTISIASDDSLIYIVFRQTNPTTYEHNFKFRRGFYKYPLFEAATNLSLGLVPESTDKDTSLTIKNKGIVPLVISQIDFPAEISTKSILFPFQILPDSSKKILLNFISQLPGTYTDTIKIYTNQQVDGIKQVIVNAEITTVSEENKNEPESFNLSQNFPNPFNPNTKINYKLNDKTGKLTIFNIRGQLVKTFWLKNQTGSVEWNGSDNFGKQVSSGIYFYKMEAGNFSETKKMLLLK
ncbi:T9SS type A sorting domain-containing protein [bacterium]|nr:T9SS type A sorting domain-containing protein [bacterium]